MFTEKKRWDVSAGHETVAQVTGGGNPRVAEGDGRKCDVGAS